MYTFSGVKLKWELQGLKRSTLVLKYDVVGQFFLLNYLLIFVKGTAYSVIYSHNIYVKKYFLKIMQKISPKNVKIHKKTTLDEYVFWI